MKPIHKFNNGLGATLCNICLVILETRLTEKIMCEDCERSAKELKRTITED